MSDELIRKLIPRYRGVSAETLQSVLAPVLLEVVDIDPRIFKEAGGPWRATFSVRFPEDAEPFMTRGRTGKFVPAGYKVGGVWREIAKGRILEVDKLAGLATGEIYIGGKKPELEQKVADLSVGDYLEIDRFGAAAKLLSGLVEADLLRHVLELGYEAKRMPEDFAKHLGVYKHYDFEITRDGFTARVEVKSLWGTDTRKARLIRSKTADNPTSSCAFATQDIFAVGMFLRTGDLSDFAFARSVSISEDPTWGLPFSPRHPTHVHQNPVITDAVDPPWSTDINVIFELAASSGGT